MKFDAVLKWHITLHLEHLMYAGKHRDLTNYSYRVACSKYGHPALCSEF